MIIKNKLYILEIDDFRGAISSFSNGKKDFIWRCSRDESLFTVRFRDANGNPVYVYSNDAEYFDVAEMKEKDQIILKLQYRFIAKGNLKVDVKVIVPDDWAFAFWYFEIDNDTDYIIDCIDFPNIIVPNDLVKSGGESKILWPAMEGVLIDDINLRDNTIIKYSPVEYPNKGWEGYYPGPCQSQFMAYYGPLGGLYFGAHDAKSNLKAIEFYKHSDGIKLEFRMFPGAPGRGMYKMEYPMVIGVFDGDWHDAAEIYRLWFESSEMEKGQKLVDNTTLPDWMKESPITAIYPVRGQMHLGDMSPNEDFFPFTNALSHINRLAESLDSKILALPMQWEGTAPWAPPYVWPPLGGENNFIEFVNGLHEKGNLAGLYCSGLAWTNKSSLIPEYNCEEQFLRDNLVEVMCAAPSGEIPHALICNDDIRVGYDMCPTSEFVEKVAIEEVSKIIDSGCDYIQYFDQNLGGASYFCYSKNHGHPPAPGLWQNNAMISLYKRLLEVAQEKGKNIIIGCEAGAAEPYIPYLPYNDLRFEIHYYYGQPVPVYAYIYHEYINNFMGNQNGACDAIDVKRSPYNLFQRVAYSFTAGDMMSIVLREGGNVHWDWCSSWQMERPDQENILSFIRHLNEWRKFEGKEYLCFGRMLKPLEIYGTYDIPMILKSGAEIPQKSVLTSRWAAKSNKSAQFIVNYTSQKQSIDLDIKSVSGERLSVCNDPLSYKRRVFYTGGNTHTFTIEPLSALMIEFEVDNTIQIM